MQISKTILTCAAVLCLVTTSARAVDSEADLRLREALRQKMAEVGPETSEPVAPKPAPKPAKVKAPKPAPTTTSAPVTPSPVAQPVPPAPVVVQPAPVAAPATSTSAEDARLREAVRARLAGEVPPPSTAPVTAPTEPAPAAAPTAPVAVTAPALPISASKEQRLSALLQQYKADQLTPQQYHEQRAKILAE